MKTILHAVWLIRWQSADRRILNQQLNEMVEDGILIKQSFNELPPRVEYTLTEQGEKLIKILWQLNDWRKLLIPEDSEV